MSHDLPTCYLLPLTGFNFKHFGRLEDLRWNLKFTRINKQRMQIAVKVADIKKIEARIFESDLFVETTSNSEIVFQIPQSLTLTFNTFLEGNYSRFTDRIKDYITKYSGLPRSHRAIGALYHDPSLIEEIEKELDVVLDPGVELVDSPMEKWFY